MPDLPHGTVTFLFAEVVVDAARWRELPDDVDRDLARVRLVLNDAVAAHAGVVYKQAGTSLQAAFPTALAGLLAAIDGQSALGNVDRGEAQAPRVRMALHTGAVDPLPDGDYRSPVLNRLGRLLDAGHPGQVLLSNITAELARDTIPEGVHLQNLGEHRLKDLTRAERITQASGPDMEQDFPPLHTLSSIPNNLRAQPTALIGRTAELALIARLLADPDVRVITLLGAGGAGKTRLSVQVAADHLEAFPDGVYFVDLASCTSPEAVPSALAQTLGIEDDPGLSILEGIHAWLDARRTLLVLDNLEQIGEIGPLVVDLIGANPNLRIVATSRSPIRVRGEREVPIEPLAVPNLRRLPHLDALSQYDSVALFIERARAVQPAFTVTNDTAPAVAEICVRLDGLPLAIELAAARIRLLPPAVMLERLTTRLPLLVDGPRDLPLRHQTLRGAIAWSYDLLTPDEQALFRRLAVFPGRASLEAVEAVATEGIDLDTLSGLERLAGHSLVRPLDQPDQPAVTILETIREFGHEQLAAAGELETTLARHATWFARVAADAFPHLLSHEQVAWFDRLATDQVNLQQAVDWSIEHDAPLAVAMVADLWWFWYVRGQLRLARSLVDAALAATPAIDSVARARALHGSATLAYVMGDSEVARTNGEAALALNRLLGNERGIPTNLNHLANVALNEDPDRAEQLYAECLAISQRLGDDNLAAVATLNLGSLAIRRDDLAAAIDHHEAALAIWRRTGDLGSQAVALANIGTITLLANGSVETALDWFDQSLVIARDLGDQIGVLTCLAGYANALGMAGHLELAARLRGAVDTLRLEPGELDDPVMSNLDQMLISHVQAALGDGRFLRLTAEGADWSLETALAEVERTRQPEQ